jgi:two-component system phosphate regulon sensor histidine kinase PhoR
MKLNRTNIFIVISSIALILVLIIQINWILQTAKQKEDLFNEKANIVLARTTEALSANEEDAANLENGRSEIVKPTIDSLLKYYMNYYNFHVEYDFEVVRSQTSFPSDFGTPGSSAATTQQPQACYNKSLDEMSSINQWRLLLDFPGKEKFVRTEMAIPFIISVVLIILVLVLFYRTVRSLVREKKIYEHTSDFLNNMTHEFKTPLTNIALAGKMIARDPGVKQEDKIKHYSGIILEENEKLRLQVEQVLSMTALERGEIPIQRTELDLHQILNACIRSISIQVENKQGDLQKDLKAERPVVTGDQTHLSNAICNLIDNAIKYSGENPLISIETFNKNGNVVLSVSDNGIGIAKEYHDKVFEKYFRVPTGNVHDIKGFGLGLAYVKKIIEMHEGTIELQSEKGSGTTFIITLPNA